jgi:hypothetical protein
MNFNIVDIEEATLECGLKVLTAFTPQDFPYSQLKLVLPVGHIHNSGEFPRGTFHLLEHVIAGNTKSHVGSLSARVRSVGGGFQALTGMDFTGYSFLLPTQMAAENFPIFLQDILGELNITEDTIASQCRIIQNERDRLITSQKTNSEIQIELWKTGYNEEDNHMCAFGSNEDLARISMQTLVNAHNFSKVSGSYIIYLGPKKVWLKLLRTLEKITCLNPHFDQLPIPRREWKEVPIRTKIAEKRRLPILCFGIEEDKEIELCSFHATREFMRYLTSEGGPILGPLRSEAALVYTATPIEDWSRRHHVSKVSVTLPEDKHVDDLVNSFSKALIEHATEEVLEDYLRSRRLIFETHNRIESGKDFFDFISGTFSLFRRKIEPEEEKRSVMDALTLEKILSIQDQFIKKVKFLHITS